MKSTLFALYATAIVASGASNAATLTGDQILARAGTATGLSSYSVPVQFDVRMHKPVSISSGAQGIVAYKAPSHASLTITKIPSLIGHFFKTSYAIDLAPQVWPSKYRVEAVSESQAGGANVYLLQSVPVNDPSVDHVIFGVTQADFSPVSAAWFYKDGSTIRLSITNERVSNYTLPQTESVSVSMPQYSLDAQVKYGEYQLNQ